MRKKTSGDLLPRKKIKDTINIAAYSWISSIHISHSIFHSYFFIFVPGGALKEGKITNYIIVSV